jgi:crossover junction endodeoxyribonuclease RusA
MITFFAAGTPAPQGSKRHIGLGVMIESSKKLKPWRLGVSAIAMQEMKRKGLSLCKGACAVELRFIMPRPKAIKNTARHSKRPDIDKLSRGVLDALTHVVYEDDSLVCELVASKWYTTASEQVTGVHVYVFERSSHGT